LQQEFQDLPAHRISEAFKEFVHLRN